MHPFEKTNLKWQLLPRIIESAYESTPHPVSCFTKRYIVERAVLKRQEERNRDRSLKQATSREELEAATIAKMKTVTGADEAICIAMLRDHGYDFEESIEAYLAKM